MNPKDYDEKANQEIAISRAGFEAQFQADVHFGPVLVGKNPTDPHPKGIKKSKLNPKKITKVKRLQ